MHNITGRACAPQYKHKLQLCIITVGAEENHNTSSPILSTKRHTQSELDSPDFAPKASSRHDTCVLRSPAASQDHAHSTLTLAPSGTTYLPAPQQTSSPHLNTDLRSIVTDTLRETGSRQPPAAK